MTYQERSRLENSECNDYVIFNDDITVQSTYQGHAAKCNDYVMMTKPGLSFGQYQRKKR